MAWRGIVGKGFTLPEFAEYASTIKFSSWRPSFVVVHNTAVPSLAQYHANQKKGITGERWMRNLEGYYRDQQGWSAGPHLFVADDKIYVFTPLTVQGTHSPSFNGTAWGVETVGDFSKEPFTGAVRDNLIGALAVLHKLRGLDPGTMKLHKEDPRTTHNCPGKNIVKADLIAAVRSAMSHGDPGDHTVDRPANPAPVVPAGGVARMLKYMPWILQDEGRGLEVRANEPGGAVNMGVTFQTFQGWWHTKGKPGEPTFADLGKLTEAEAADIYGGLYYLPIRGPELPAGIDYVWLDAAITLGVRGSIKLAQSVLGVTVDGVLGPKTFEAATKTNPADFVTKFCAAWLATKNASTGWPKFGKGWTNRNGRVLKRGLELAKT